MTIAPRLEPDLDAATWDALARECPAATFFHGSGWYAAQHEALDYVPAACRLSWSDGRWALLPLAVRPRFRGMVRAALAGVEGGYGGLLTPTPLEPAAIAAAWRAVSARFPDLTVAGNPFAPAAELPQGGAHEPDETRVVALRPREEQIKAMDEARRKKVRRGLKAGFRLEVVTPVTPADVARFFPLYQARTADWTYRRWVRDRRYFEALARHAGHAMALFLAWAGDELAGFQLLGLQGRHASAMYLATAVAHEPQQVGPFLAIEPMSWCHERGFADYDLLASGPLESVKAYKASLGAAPMSFEAVRLADWKTRSIERLVALRATPEVFARAIGFGGGTLPRTG